MTQAALSVIMTNLQVLWHDLNQLKSDDERRGDGGGGGVDFCD